MNRLLYGSLVLITTALMGSSFRIEFKNHHFDLI